MIAALATDVLADLRDRYLAAQLRGDRREALRLLADDGVRSGVSVEALRRDVVEAAQREIGLLWQKDRITVAEEHMATAISQLALAHIFHHGDRAPDNGRSITVACVEGELHDFPARILADELDGAGFDVRFLGANVPSESLARMIAGSPPDLLCLSITMTVHAAALRDAVSWLRRLGPPRLPIAVGGHACVWSVDLARQVGADMSALDARSFVAAARRLFGV